MVKVPSPDFVDPYEVQEEERSRIAGRPTRIEGLPDTLPEETAPEKVTQAQAQVNEWDQVENTQPEPAPEPVDYSWARKFGSGVPGFIYGAGTGLAHGAQALGVLPTGGNIDLYFNYFTDDNFYQKLNSAPSRKTFLELLAYNKGRGFAEEVDKQDKDFAKAVTARPPQNLLEYGYPGTTFHRELPGQDEEKTFLTEALGLYIDEGFKNSPLYKASPVYWDTLEAEGNPEFDQMVSLYDESYELKRRTEYPEYNTVFEGYQGFVDHSIQLAQQDAGWWQGVKQDFTMMGAGTWEFLLTGSGFGEDKVNETPWESSKKMGAHLTGGLLGAVLAAVEPDRGGAVFPEGMPLIGGARMPAGFRKPMIILGLAGPKIMNIVRGKISKAQAKRVAEFRKKDPAFDAMLRKFEMGEAAYPKASQLPPQVRYGKALNKLDQATGIPSQIGRALEAPITKAVKIGDDGIARPRLPMRTNKKVLKGKKEPSFGEPVPGAPRQMQWGDLTSSLLHGAGMWVWTGAPELGFLNPGLRLAHSALQNNNFYNGALNKMRAKFQRSWENTTEDTPTADRMSFFHHKIQDMARETRGAEFVSQAKQQAKDGTPPEWTPMPDVEYLAQERPGEVVMGGVFDPQRQPEARTLTPRIVAVKGPPLKGGDPVTPAEVPTQRQAQPQKRFTLEQLREKADLDFPLYDFPESTQRRPGFGEPINAGTAAPERPPAYSVQLGQGGYDVVNVMSKTTAQGIENARMIPAMKQAAQSYIKDMQDGIALLKKAIAKDKVEAPGRKGTWAKANKRRRQEIAYLESSINAIETAVREISETLGREAETSSGLQQLFAETKFASRGTKESINKSIEQAAPIADQSGVAGVEVFAFKDLIWESARDILEAENEALLTRQASVLKKLEVAHGRRAVANALNESRKEGTADLTPDGTIIEGTPLARLVQEGAPVRRTRPQGDYARQDKRGAPDPSEWTLDRDGRPIKEDTYYAWETLAEEVPVSEGAVWLLDSKGRPILRESMDVTKGNPDALSTPDFLAKLDEGKMRPKRNVAPGPRSQRAKEIDTFFDESKSALEELSFQDLAKKAGELGLLVKKPKKKTLVEWKGTARATEPQLTIDPKTGQFIKRSKVTSAQDVAVYEIGNESFTIDAAGRAKLIDKIARLEASEKAFAPEVIPETAAAKTAPKEFNSFNTLEAFNKRKEEGFYKGDGAASKQYKDWTRVIDQEGLLWDVEKGNWYKPKEALALESAAQKRANEQGLAKERATIKAEQSVARAEQGLSFAKQKAANILDEVNKRSQQQQEYLGRPRSTRAKAVIARTRTANKERDYAASEQAKAKDLVNKAEQRLKAAKENLRKEQQQPVATEPRKAEATTQRAGIPEDPKQTFKNKAEADRLAREQKAEDAAVAETGGPAKQTAKQVYYKTQFDLLTNRSLRGEQVGLDMYNLMRGLAKEPDIQRAKTGEFTGVPFDAKQGTTKLKMFKSALSYMPEGLGTKGKTTDPTRYPNARAEVEAYIKGEMPRDLLAKEKRTVDRFGEQLNKDINRIDEAFIEGKITPDERVSSLADLLKQLDEDIMEGLREVSDEYLGDKNRAEPALEGFKRRDTSRKKPRFARSVVGRYALRRAESKMQPPPKGMSVVEAKGVKSLPGITTKKRGPGIARRLHAKEVIPLLESARLSLENAQTQNVSIPRTREYILTKEVNKILEGREATSGSNQFKQMVAQARDAYGKNQPLTQLLERAYESSMSMPEKFVFERVIRSLEADTGKIYQGIQRVFHNKKTLKAELARANEVKPDVPAMEVDITSTQKGSPLKESKPPTVGFRQDFPSIGDVPMPQWLKSELQRTRLKFEDKAGMSPAQSNAFLASIMDAFSDGISLLASPTAKKYAAEGAIRAIEQQLGRPLNKAENARLTKAFNDYLQQFDRPFEGRSSLAEYADAPDYSSPAALARSVIRKIPSNFLIKGKDGAVLATVNPGKIFFNELSSLRKRDAKGKANKDLKKIQDEAYQVIYNKWVAQAKKELINKFVKAEMDRLNISYGSTLADAATRIAISRELYQDSMPIALPSRLAELVDVVHPEGTYQNRELTVVSAKDIANTIRTNPETIIEGMNAELKANGKKALTNEQVLELTGNRPSEKYPVEVGSKLDQLAAKLEKYESPQSLAKNDAELYNKFADAFAMKDQDLSMPAFLAPDGNWVTSPLKEAAYTGAKNKRTGLDTSIQEFASDGAMGSFMHPDWMESVAFNAQLFDAMSSMNTWNSIMKGNVTFGAMLTHLGNTLSHSLAAALHRGQNPISLYNDVAMTAWAFRAWSREKSGFANKASGIKDAGRWFDRDAFEALDAYASLKNLDFISVENVKPIFGGDSLPGKAFGLKEKALKKLYQMEDNAPRLFEAVSEYKSITKDLSKLKDGEFLELQTSRNGYAVITKRGERFMQGGRELNQQGLRKLKVSQAMWRASNRVVNYSHIPRFIKEMRIGNMGMLATFISPFISFPYLALDIPYVKKGILAGTLFDGGMNSRGKTNSVDILTSRSRQDTLRAVRVGAYGMAMAGIAHPNTNDLQEMNRFKQEPGSVSSALVRSTPNHNVIQTWRWNNANQFEMTFLALENILAAQAWIASGYLEATDGGLFGSKKPNKTMRYFQRATAEGRVLTPKDITRLGALSGNFWLRPLVKMLYSDDSGRSKGWLDLPAALDGLAGALIGTDNWSFAKTAAPLAGYSPKGQFSSYRSLIDDLERTDQLQFEKLNPQQQMDFMLEHFVEGISRVYFRSRKILENDKQINQATRNLLTGIRGGMINGLDKQIKESTNETERRKLQSLRTLVDRSIKKYAKAQGDFYRKLRDVEAYRGVVSKDKLAKDKGYNLKLRLLQGARGAKEDARQTLDREQQQIKQRAKAARERVK